MRSLPAPQHARAVVAPGQTAANERYGQHFPSLLVLLGAVAVRCCDGTIQSLRSQVRSGQFSIAVSLFYPHHSSSIGLFICLSTDYSIHIIVKDDMALDNFEAGLDAALGRLLCCTFLFY